MNIVIVGCGNVGLEAAKALVTDHRLLLISRRLSPEVKGFIADHPDAAFAEADAIDIAGMARVLTGEDQVQRIDVLISTVGAPGSASALDDFESYRDDFNVNIFGNLVPIQAVLKRMISQRSGKIVVISSTSGVHTYPGWGAYAPSKWALTNLCRTLRQEVGPHGISIDVVFPRTICNARSRAFLNDAGIEPQEVARDIVAVLDGKKGTERFVPRRHALLRPLERVMPQLLDKKAGLQKGRYAKFSAVRVESVLIHEPTSALGREIARCYAAVANTLYLVGSDKASLTAMREEITSSSSCAVRDIIVDGEDGEAIGAMPEQTGPVDLIVSCGGSSVAAELSDISLEVCHRSLAVGFFHPLQFILAYLQCDMAPRKIAVVLSDSVVTGRPQHGCFYAGQAALWAQTRAMRRTLGNDVQVMEVLWRMPAEPSRNGHSTGARRARELAGKIQDAERRGKEIVVFPFISRLSLYADAICPRVFE